MNENREERVRRPLVRIKGKGLAVVTLSHEVYCGAEHPYIRKQIARTIGMPWDFGHPDIEVFYKMDDAPYSQPLLGYIHSNIAKGIRYKAGDRFSYKRDTCGMEYTVEFRAVTVGGEDMLRAVILELDAEYQALSTAEAVALVDNIFESEAELFSMEWDDDLF